MDEKYSLNEDGSELVIKDVKKVDEGDYTCIAKNKAGEKSEEVSLNVFGKKITPSVKEHCFCLSVAGLFFCTYCSVQSSTGFPMAEHRAMQCKADSLKNTF